MKKLTSLILILTIGLIFGACSEITNGNLVDVPNPNSIVVEGFTGSVALNGIDENTSTAWFDVLLVTDVGSNINPNSIGDRITLKFDRSRVDYWHSNKPYRSILIAEKTDNSGYWKLISVERE